MELRKKILNLNEGLIIYSQLLKDEETILIPFAISQYVTVCRIDELLLEYLADLERNECKESLCIDFDQMTSADYWMGKLVKLRNDMEMLGTVPMKAHGFVVTVLGFSLTTTMDLYRAIKQKVMQMVAMLKEMRRLLMEAPKELYSNFYRSQRDGFDAQKTVARYEQWKREVGVVTLDLLIDKQILEVVEFLKKKVLRHMLVPSERERCQVDFEKLHLHLPHGYEFPKEFPDCCARFMRIASKDGDILRINHDCYGKYLHQFFYSLSDNDRQALFDLDITLQLIHQDMAEMKPNETECLTSSIEDRIRHCIALLMKERMDDEPLFNLQSHWQAVYRILVDKGYCRDSDFDGFDAFIQTVMPDEVNKPYKKDSLKQISQTDFVRPFKEWHYDAETSKTRKPFNRMVAIAMRFTNLLEENGL